MENLPKIDTMQAFVAHGISGIQAVAIQFCIYADHAKLVGKPFVPAGNDKQSKADRQQLHEVCDVFFEGCVKHQCLNEALSVYELFDYLPQSSLLQWFVKPLRESLASGVFGKNGDYSKVFDNLYSFIMAEIPRQNDESDQLHWIYLYSWVFAASQHLPDGNRSMPALKLAHRLFKKKLAIGFRLSEEDEEALRIFVELSAYVTDDLETFAGYVQDFREYVRQALLLDGYDVLAILLEMNEDSARAQNSMQVMIRNFMQPPIVADKSYDGFSGE